MPQTGRKGLRGVSLSASAALMALVALGLSSCKGAPPVDADPRFQFSSELASRAPAEWAILPVEDGAGNFAELDLALRQQLAESLAMRRYSPLNPVFVDEQLGGARGGGSPVDATWLGSAGSKLGADALLGLRIVKWDLSEIDMSKPRVAFDVEMLLLDARDGTVLGSGRYVGDLKPGGDGAAEIARNARIEQAARTLAENLAGEIPERPRQTAAAGGSGS